LTKRTELDRKEQTPREKTNEEDGRAKKEKELKEA
jgi:hypothetical protein